MKITIEFHSNRGRRMVQAMTDSALIVDQVCHFFGVSTLDLESKKRPWPIVWPRWVAIYLIRKHTDLPLEKIGILFKKGHCTVMHALNGVQKQISTDSKSYDQIIRIEHHLAVALNPGPFDQPSKKDAITL